MAEGNWGNGRRGAKDLLDLDLNEVTNCWLRVRIDSGIWRV